MDALRQPGLDVVVPGEPFVGQVHLHQTAVNLATAVVEPLDRRAVPGRELVRLSGSGLDATALGLRQRLEPASPSALVAIQSCLLYCETRCSDCFHASLSPHRCPASAAYSSPNAVVPKISTCSSAVSWTPLRRAFISSSTALMVRCSRSACSSSNPCCCRKFSSGPRWRHLDQRTLCDRTDARRSACLSFCGTLAIALCLGIRRRRLYGAARTRERMGAHQARRYSGPNCCRSWRSYGLGQSRGQTWAHMPQPTQEARVKDWLVIA